MRLSAPLLGLVPLLLTLGAVARADVVHLTTGRSIQGTVIADDEREVVVKTPNGKVTLPRRLVKKIERQTKGATLLALARERAALGALKAAEELFARAAEDDDPEVAREAARELTAIRAKIAAGGVTSPVPAARSGRRSRRSARGSSQSSLPPLAGGAFVRSVRGREVVLALRAGDPGRVHQLLNEVEAEFVSDPSFRYLRGRAYELQRDETHARHEYELVLTAGGLKPVPVRPAAWLGELARRRLAGETLTATSPGVGAEWKRIETANFAIYHPFDSTEPWFAKAPEDALDGALDLYGVRSSELVMSGRIQVFLFPDAEAYKSAGGPELAGGHAHVTLAPDGYLKRISAYPDRFFYTYTYRHEIAHTVLLELHPAMPAWAQEGAAVFAEPLRMRGYYRRFVNGKLASGGIHPTLSFLRDEVPRGSNKEEVRAYYAQASVTFEALYRLLRTSGRTLSVCDAFADGPEAALDQAGLNLKKLQQEIEQVAADTTRDR